MTWAPPTTPNGRIMNYIIDVDRIDGNNLIRRTITDVDKGSFMELITDATLLSEYYFMGHHYSITILCLYTCLKIIIPT